MYLSELEKKVFVALMRYVCLFQFELITCAVCSAHCTHIMQSFCCQCFHLYICAKERMRMNKLSMSGKSKFKASSQQIFSVSLLMTKDKVKLRGRILACKPQNTSSQANNLYPHPQHHHHHYYQVSPSV